MGESFLKYLIRTFQTQMRRGWWERKEMLGVLSPLALCLDVGMKASRSSAQGWGRLSVGRLINTAENRKA